MNYNINATILKHWYQYGCERKLLYSADKIEEKIPMCVVPETFSAEIKHPGTIFEEEVVAQLSQNNLVYQPKDNSKELTSTQWNHFVRKIDGKPTAFACQVLVYGESIATILQLPPNISLRRGYIDLIRRTDVGDQIELTIIDIKYSPISTHFHRIQVAYYARILSLELQQLHAEKQLIKPVTISTYGEIWIPSEDPTEKWIIEKFDIQPYENELDYFFQHEITRLSQIDIRPTDNSHFHLYYKCEQCKYHLHCLQSIQTEKPEDMDLSAIFGLTQYSKRKLIEKNIRSVGDMSTLPSNHFENETLWKLHTAGETFIARAKALVEAKTIFINGSRTIMMSPVVDIPIILCVDRSPTHGHIVSIGISIKTIDGTVNTHIQTISQQKEERLILEQMLSIIQEQLIAVNLWNETHAEDKKICTIFTYEQSELQNLKESMKTYIVDTKFQQNFSLLLRIITPDGLIPDPQYHKFTTNMVSTLRSTVEHLYAIPAKVTYDLARVSQTLEQTTDFTGAYYPTPEFEHPFSSQLSMDQVAAIRNNTAKIEDIHQDVTARLAACLNLIDWLITENNRHPTPFLCAQLDPFTIYPEEHTMHIGDIKGLYAQTKLGTNISIREHLHTLSLPLHKRIQLGQTWGYLTLIQAPKLQEKEYLLQLETSQPKPSDIDISSFNTFLHPEDATILLQNSKHNTYKCTIIDIQFSTNNTTYLTVKLTGAVYKRLQSQLIVGSSWTIDMGMNPINDSRMQTFLDFLQNHSYNL